MLRFIEKRILPPAAWWLTLIALIDLKGRIPLLSVLLIVIFAYLTKILIDDFLEDNPNFL